MTGAVPTPNLTDETIARCVAGDPKARAELISASLPRIWRTVCLTCGGSSEVEDLVQTAMMRALDKLDSYHGPGRFFAWLDRVTVNEIRKYFGKWSLRLQFPATDMLEGLAAQSNTAPDRRLEGQQLFRRLGVHLLRIRSKNRVALALSLVDGYTAVEIAEIVGCSVEAAQKRVRRGQLELLARLAKDPQFEKELEEWLS